MYIDALKEKLEKRERILAPMIAHVGFSDLPSLYKDCGADFIILDLEHSPFFPENIWDICQAGNKAGMPIIARVQDCGYYYISKSLDMGADGVLIPRTETIEQVETAISSMRVSPVGKKGVGGALLRPGEDVYDVNKNRLLFIQIESVKGINLLDEMLTKYGHEIAGILIGPCDLSVSMGFGTYKSAPEVDEQIRRIIAICQSHKKSVGMMMGTDEVCAKWAKEGMNVFWRGGEGGMIAAGLRIMKQRTMEY